jgi:hypothetical protein
MSVASPAFTLTDDCDNARENSVRGSGLASCATIKVKVKATKIRERIEVFIDVCFYVC